MEAEAEFPPDEVQRASFDADAPVPDAVDLVVEVATMRSVFAAQQYRRIDALRCEAHERDARRALECPSVDPAGEGVMFARNARRYDILDRSLRLELAAALRVTEYAAGMLLAQAEALVHRYPAVLASLEAGGMTERHADVLVDLVDSVGVDLREGLVPVAIVLAEHEPVGTFRRALQKLVDTLRAQSLPERYESAVATRRVVVEPGEDGMAWFGMFMPAVEAHAAYGRATAIANEIQGQEGETRTLDQIRADVVADLLIDGRTDEHPESARGIRASVVVTVPALSLLDSADAPGEPPVVEGIGPIPIGRARELCGGDDGWMRVLTHPETGMVLSVGRDRYRPPAALRKLVAWRAGKCMAPGCTMPASRCQIDHNVAWEHGGHTALSNHAPFCQGHHTIKHHGGWAIRQIDGGAIEWTSPTGRRYLVQPERSIPVSFVPQRT